jgi:hypothetical protein
MFGPPFSPSLAFGVDQTSAAPGNVVPPVWRGVGLSAVCAQLATVAVGHDEQSLASVARANVGRAPYSDRNAATQSLQCRDESCELSVRVPRDVLAEETTSPAFIEDADDLIDEESLVVGTAALSGDAVGLAGITRQDAIHSSTPCSSVECGNVSPDRRRSQLSRFHARCQDRGGICFPLDVADRASARNRHFNADTEHSGTGAELNISEGTCSQVMHSHTPAAAH